MAESASVSTEVQDNLVQMVRQAQEGSNAAAEAVFERCRVPLLAVIRRVIFAPLRRLYDSDDFLLDTFAEVFTRHFTDEVLKSPATLWPYLKRIAENKVRDAERKYLVTRAYNIQRDVPIDELTDEPASRELRPDENSMLKELVEERLIELIGQLPSMLQQIVRLLLKGRCGLHIAHQLNVEPKRVYRAMDWLKGKILAS